MDKRLYTTTEAAGLLDVTPARVRQMVARGEIAFERIGRDNFVTADAIAEAQKRKTKPGPAPKPKDDGQQKDRRKVLKRKALARWEGEGGATVPAKRAGKKGGNK